MFRVLIGIFLLLLTLGLGVVHFSLVQAQPPAQPPAQDTETPEPTPTPTRPPASASMTPSSGPVNAQIRINGQNFDSGESVEITFNGQREATATADSSGSFSASFDVPALPAGRYPVRAGSIFVGDFNITSTFTLSPRSGPPGTSVQILGTGFSPGVTVDLNIGGMPWESLTTDGEGAIRGSFQIPQVSGGSKSIAVSGGGGSASANFEVTPTVTVDQGTASPGATVNLSGTGFQSNETGISIRLDSETVTSGISADQQGRWTASFTVPATTAGSHTIRVSAPRTTASIPTAQLSVGAGVSIDRASGPPGTVVKLSGSGVRANERVTIDVGGGLAIQEVLADNRGVWSHDLTIPPAPGGRLAIRASGSAGQSAETSFSVVPSMNLSSPRGFPGGSLSITGQGFGANQSGISITFDGDIVTSATANGQGSWEADFEVPPAPKGNYSIRVTGVTPELQVPFTINPGVALNNAQAGPGETVTVNGGGFEPNETGITVRLGENTIATGIAANADGSWSRTFEIPPLPAGSYPLTASGSATSGGSVQAHVLTLGAHVTLSSVSGPPGSDITVTGRGFGANEADISITYDDTPVVSGVIADRSGSFTTSFVLPPSPVGQHSIRVSGSSPGAVAGSDIAFQVVPGITLPQTSGAPGSTMELRGQGFGANEQNIEIKYDGETVLTGVSADASGSFVEPFPLPPSPAGDHNIEAAGPASTTAARAQQRFTVVPGLTLSEAQGNVGMDVAVAGRGFNPSSTITLIYDDLTEATITSDDRGSFNVQFAIPQSEKGKRSISALDEAGNRAEHAFVVEDTPPPAPNLRAPSNGSSGGIFGGFRPDTRWLPVEDPSGVTYTVQIATDPDFRDIVVEQEGLPNPTYTLAEVEALERGKYYWRVKAVDGAFNESPWSGAYVMNSGIIPVWVVPAMVVLGLLASGGGAYAYYTRVYRPRKLAQEGPAFPEFVRISRPEIAAAPQSPPAASSAPALSAPRRALPSPFRKGTRGPSMSPEEQARLQMVVDFVRSIPLLEVSPDLTWLEEIVESLGGTTDDIYEQVLRGDIEPVYQPAWMQHPTYQELQNLQPAQAFLHGLEEYIELVNDCAAETLSILRNIYRDLDAGGALDAMGERNWRFVLTVGLSSLAWFRGTYLGQPSAREYIIKPDSESATESRASLYGVESSPFSGPVLEGLNQDDVVFFRDLHVQLRNSYRNSEEARALAAKMTSTGAMRDQLMQAIAQMGEQAAHTR